MKFFKTYMGNIRLIENKINLLYNSEINKDINITDLKVSVNGDEATVAVLLDIRKGKDFIDCSHINRVRLERYKRSRILYFTIEDGREYKLVMSNRFLFGRTTGIYYNNNKIGNLQFRNRLSIDNLRNIVIDFFESTGILISVTELKRALKEGQNEWNKSLGDLAY